MRKGYKLPMIPPRGHEFRLVVVASETPYNPPRGGIKNTDIKVFTNYLI
jgi:hypothetical protein